jgi:hypothetical protein
MARSRWSLWSEDSVLSIASRGSVLSIGSVGSAASVLSIGSFGSFGSVMSSLSGWSFLSSRSLSAALADRERAPVDGRRALVMTAAIGALAAVAAGPRQPRIASSVSTEGAK